MNRSIAILIPCYNSAAYLPELFEGIRSQTIPFDEIICYDDYSSDNTVEIAEKLGAKVIRGIENKGAAFARNRLAESTNCDWMHFHDSDDLIDPHFVEIMKKHIRNEDIQLLCNTFVFERNNRNKNLGNITYDTLAQSNDQLVYFLHNVGFASMGLYSKKALTTIGGFREDIRGNEDPDLHIRLVAKGYVIQNIPEYMVTKLEHQHSFSHQNWFRCLSDKLVCLQTYGTVLDSKYFPLLGEQAAALSNYFYRENDKELSRNARLFAYQMGVKNMHTSTFANIVTLVFGIRMYLWIYRRRIDLKKISCMNSSLISIIIPVYNAEKYIAETIQSALNQTWKYTEIIIINDGSTDNSFYVAKQFENEKLKIFSQENKGASAARNYGLKIAKGEYIQFLDADDMLGINKIEEQVKVLINNPEKVAVCPTINFFDEDTPMLKEMVSMHDPFLFDTGNPVDFLINLYGGNGAGGMIQPNSWLTHKKIIDRAGWWNEALSLDDDGEFFCRVILQSQGIIYTPGTVNYYRKFRKGKSLSAQTTRKAMESVLASTSLKHSHLLSKTDSLLAKKTIARLYMQIATICYPQFIDLSQTAEKNIAVLGEINYVPVIGGNFTELIKKIFGWKFVKWLQFFYYKL